MKTFRIIPIIAMMVLVGCRSNKQIARDDVYYSPYGESQMSGIDGSSYVNSGITGKSQYDYQNYYSDSKNYVSDVKPVYQTSETVTDTNGVVYTTTETYYDADYASRIKRFGSSASSNRDYYDDYYVSSGSTYNIYVNDYYDPFYWDFYPRVYVSFGWGCPCWSCGWGWGWNWGGFQSDNCCL